ncbi:hypothetical protein OOZ15_19535 [Galbibacter sp. EGI 63066]|uniref:RHS repeat domain-containing protein n=1 Tax=Galbibacter sp. EGI 63066 TaxID=2993559 RepID=UPI0022491CFF|nr:RHS repeat-associated core domain-containing protein [Galbibacter sp. EGI 63066]MCX2682148.1 hypothetical protein [Galbibacter sp. EGI 63066]
MDADNNGNVTTDEVIEESNYYPFGLKHMGYGPSISSLGNDVAQRWKYNGKEFDESLDINTYDFGARHYMPDIVRTPTMGPHAESYFSVSPYSFFANNPISFVDPTGEDILFWQWERDDELTLGGTWKQVTYDQLDEKTQKGLEAFAKTESGFAFFSKFANKGDKIGSVEFGATGDYANHNLNFGELETGNEGGTPPPINQSAFGPMQEGKTNNYVDFFLRVNYNIENSEINIPETIGHEAFLHLSQYVDDYIKAFEANDSEGAQTIIDKHQEGNPSGARDHLSMYYKTKKAQKYYTFINQLKSIFNPREVQKHIDNERAKNYNHAKFKLKKSERKGY